MENLAADVTDPYNDDLERIEEVAPMAGCRGGDRYLDAMMNHLGR